MILTLKEAADMENSQRLIDAVYDARQQSVTDRLGSLEMDGTVNIKGPEDLLDHLDRI